MRGIGIIVTIAIAAIVGVGAYQLGLAHGAAVTGTAAAPAVYYPFFWGGFGFIFPLLFLFLIFGLARAAFWGGRGYGGWGRGPNGGDGPSRLEEWHKRAHGEARGDTSSQPSPSGR
jgi:hypothetical protein